MTDEKTYGETNRRSIKQFTVSRLTPPREEGGNYELAMTGDWTVPALPPEVGDKLLLAMPDDVLEYEVVGISRIVGWRMNGEWLRRSSDQDMALEDELMHAAFEEEARAMLKEHEVEWAEREKKLPDWLQDRIQHFHTAGGQSFKLNGWGYEIVIAELAAMYYETAPDFHATDEINAYDDREGCSGNQHGSALHLAKMHYSNPERSFAGTTAALPFNGMYYEES